MEKRTAISIKIQRLKRLILLSAKENIISIVGKDTDSTFFGIATLQMMLTSYEDPALRSVQIEDFSDIQYRGFIEGFYGGGIINHGKAL